MHYFSTNKQSETATFREAVLAGQPSDSGLYFPSEIPPFPSDLIQRLPEMPNPEIAFEVIRPFVDGEIPDHDLRRICEETVDFDFPLVHIADGKYALELFHGPTLAFKDVGARFMSRCLSHFADSARKTVVVVATSGDTGGAVAAGFHGVPNVEVVILYPKGRVSRVQELQLTTLGGNVTTLELQGSFDDCQTLAKRALADGDILARVNLTSANSINVARWLPQQFYYLFALKQWKGEPPAFSVPSGNFGNLAAGLLAHIRGMPAARFIAACNANDVVPRYMGGGKYEPLESVATLSNAMDVGNPSNFVRILQMFSNSREDLGRVMSAVTISDDVTAETMRHVYHENGYTLDPHGAVAFRALADTGESGIFLETAHPVKFDSVTDVLNEATTVPDSIKDLLTRRKLSTEIPNRYEELREVILSKA